MEAKEAIILADKISWGYNKASRHSSIINQAILEHLGSKKYILFCEKINVDPRVEVRKAHQENFLTTYIDNSNDVISDFTITINWTLRKIFLIVSEII